MQIDKKNICYADKLYIITNAFKNKYASLFEEEISEEMDKLIKEEHKPQVRLNPLNVYDQRRFFKTRADISTYLNTKKNVTVNMVAMKFKLNFYLAKALLESMVEENVIQTETVRTKGDRLSIVRYKFKSLP